MPGMKGMYLAESVAVRVHGVGVGLDAYCDAFALHSCKRFNIPVSRLHDPDLTDPATVGCLLALVREAWESPKANLSWVTDDECMVVFDPGHAQKFLLASTEAEALVAALEGAPNGITSGSNYHYGSKDEAAYWEKVSLDEDARIFAMLDLIIEEKENK
jgi:hypothetical protein